MKAIISIIIAIFVFSPQIQAYELAATVGAQTTAISTSTSGTSAKSGTGLYAGLLGFMDIGDEHYIRAGALLSQRKYSVNSTGLSVDVETLNLDVPITYMVLLDDMFGVFGGARLGLNFSDKCTANVNVTCDAPETLYLAAEAGGQMRFTPNIALELVFNFGFTDIATNTSWDNSIVVGGMFLF